MVDIGGCWGLTLSEAYASMTKENVQQFLLSPYTAKLPGGESLRDVVVRCPSTLNPPLLGPNP